MAQANVLQEARDRVNFSRVNSLNEQSFQNQLALQSFISDKNLEQAADIATGSLFGSILGSAANAIFD